MGIIKSSATDGAKALIQSTEKRRKVPNTSILQSTINPFVKSNGELVNKYIDYQKVLDNPKVSAKAKSLISDATGLSPSVTSQPAIQPAAKSAIVTTRGADTANIAPSGNSVVDTAMQYLGTQYVWGGASPEGFDCSGLMQYSFAQNGISIPRTSQEQYKAGTAVSKENLQPGDMVFFKGSGGTATAPGHVGLYIGNNQYIQAPKTGDVVKISDLSARSDYTGARRIS